MTEIERLVIGFLAAAEFADCTDDHMQGLADAEWSDAAREDALRLVSEWRGKVSDDDWADAVCRTPGHYAFDFDAVAGMGTGVYYGMAGHGVGFWDRDELREGGLGERLHAACKFVGAGIGVYLGDDGERYFG